MIVMVVMMQRGLGLLLMVRSDQGAHLVRVGRVSERGGGQGQGRRAAHLALDRDGVVVTDAGRNVLPHLVRRQDHVVLMVSVRLKGLLMMDISMR